MSAVKFAHLTDLHLPIRTPPHLKEILNKRALGYASWLRRRRYWHKAEVASALAADAKAQGAAAALISGDLVNIGLPAEFDDAAAWLDRNFSHLPLVFAPGNHDTYVRETWTATLGKIAHRMAGRRLSDPALRSPRDFNDFPFIASAPELPGIVVIVANSSPPTNPILASGALGAGQIGKIKAELQSAGARGLFRILLLHHPICDGVVSRRKALDDRADLAAAIGSAGVELVLHGHAHIQHVGSIATPLGTAPAIGGASASHARAGGHYRPGRYNLISVEQRGTQWAMSLTVREFDPATGGVLTAESREFRIPAGAQAQPRAAAI